VKALDNDGSEKPLKRVTVDVRAPSFHDLIVANFVTSKSLHFFETLNLVTGFLTVDPSDWDTREDYQKAADFVRLMKVVNDSSERGVALLQSYNILTKSEDQ
jgi:hypothetical protein